MPDVEQVSIEEMNKLLGSLYATVTSKKEPDYAQALHNIQRLRQMHDGFVNSIPEEHEQLLKEQKETLERLEYVNAHLKTGLFGTVSSFFESAEDAEEQDNLRGEKSMLDAKAEQLEAQLRQNEAAQDTLQDAGENIQHIVESLVKASSKLGADSSVQQKLECFRMLNSLFGMTKSIEVKSKCMAASKTVFKQLLQDLPVELEIIRVLYAMGEQRKVDAYLTEFLALKPNDRDAYQAFLVKLSDEIDAVANERAKYALMLEAELDTVSNPEERAKLKEDPLFALTREKTITNPPAKTTAELLYQTFKKAKDIFDDTYNLGDYAQKREAAKVMADYTKFQDLPIDVQEQLIEMRAFLIKMSSFLGLSDIKPDDPRRAELSADYKDLQTAIINVMQNHENIAKAQEIRARVEGKLGKLEEDMVGHIYNRKLYNWTNAKVVAGAAAGVAVTQMTGVIETAGIAVEVLGAANPTIRAGTFAAWCFSGPKAKALAGVYAAATIPALRDIAKEEATQQAKQELRGAGSEYLKTMDAVDADYILQIDQLFKMQTAKPLSEIKIETGTFFSQSRKVAWKAFISYPLQLFNKLPRMVRIAIVAAALIAFIAPVAAVIAATPPLWPVAAAVAGVVVAGVAAVGLATYGNTIAQKMSGGAARVTRGAVTAIEFVTRPFRDLTNNVQKGNYLGATLKVGLAAGAAALGAVVLPIALPALGLASAIGAAAGLYLGLSAGSAIEGMQKSAVVSPVDFSYVQKLETVQRPADFELTKQEIQFLKNLTNIQGFDQKFQELFVQRQAELLARVDAQRASALQDPVAVAKVTGDVEHFFADLAQIRAAIAMQDKGKFCDVLDKIVLQQAQEERQKLVAIASERHKSGGVYTERARNLMGFGAVKTKLSQVEPESGPFKKPQMTVEYNQVNYQAERAKMDKLIEMQKITQSIRQGLK